MSVQTKGVVTVASLVNPAGFVVEPTRKSVMSAVTDFVASKQPLRFDSLLLGTLTTNWNPRDDQITYVELALWPCCRARKGQLAVEHLCVLHLQTEDNGRLRQRQGRGQLL